MRTFIAILGRNAIRLLLVFLAVALVTLLLAWRASMYPDPRCGKMPDGSIVFCE
jgi:hypothetical protein